MQTYIQNVPVLLLATQLLGITNSSHGNYMMKQKHSWKFTWRVVWEPQTVATESKKEMLSLLPHTGLLPLEEITRKEMPHALVSFPVIMRKIPNESNLRDQGFILAHNSRRLFLTVGKSNLQELEASDSITPTIRSRALWMLASTQLTFTILYTPWFFALGLVLTTIELDPSTINRIKMIFPVIKFFTTWQWTHLAPVCTQEKGYSTEHLRAMSRPLLPSRRSSRLHKICLCPHKLLLGS